MIPLQGSFFWSHTGVMPHAPNSPFETYANDTLGWLRRRVDANNYISPDDVARVYEANPDASDDPLLRELVLRGLRGGLGPRRGRPRAGGIGRKIMLMAISEMLPEEREYVKAGAVRRRGDLEPGLQAANRLARKYKLILGNIDGRTLLNQISALKKQLNFHE